MQSRNLPVKLVFVSNLLKKSKAQYHIRRPRRIGFLMQKYLPKEKHVIILLTILYGSPTMFESSELLVSQAQSTCFTDSMINQAIKLLVLMTT